jgi:diguanylate cyclase (GGDEF)-like protein
MTIMAKDDISAAAELDGASRTPAPFRPGDPLRGALLDSRQRWRDLVAITADFAFETDAAGRLIFVSPDPALGWPASLLIGQPAELLLAEQVRGAGFNPFRAQVPAKRQRVWLKRGDKSTACVAFAAAPVYGPDGRVAGARGLGVDMTEFDQTSAQVAAALRRGEVLDHILWRMGQEVLAPRMMRGALEALLNALGAEGSAVVAFSPDGKGPELPHHAGVGAEAVLHAVASLVHGDPYLAAETTGDDGRQVLVAACQTRFGGHAGLAVWRPPGSRQWDGEDRLLLGSASSIIRMVLEHDAIQQEMVRQARTDPLTGLLNRRAFLEEIARHIERLDYEQLPGTLMFADLDHFKPVNDQLGHEAGDQVLLSVAALLRKTVRPTDLVARLGGDEFALWLNGADNLSAAERAEDLRVAIPRETRELTGDASPTMNLSIGIATRSPGSGEPIDSVMRRADLAMYEVKRCGRGHWRVAPEDAA